METGSSEEYKYNNYFSIQINQFQAIPIMSTQSNVSLIIAASKFMSTIPASGDQL